MTARFFWCVYANDEVNVIVVKHVFQIKTSKNVDLTTCKPTAWFIGWNFNGVHLHLVPAYFRLSNIYVHTCAITYTTLVSYTCMRSCSLIIFYVLKYSQVSIQMCAMLMGAWRACESCVCLKKRANIQARRKLWSIGRVQKWTWQSGGARCLHTCKRMKYHVIAVTRMKYHVIAVARHMIAFKRRGLARQRKGNIGNKEHTRYTDKRFDMCWCPSWSGLWGV